MCESPKKKVVLSVGASRKEKSLAVSLFEVLAGVVVRACFFGSKPWHQMHCSPVTRLGFSFVGVGWSTSSAWGSGGGVLDCWGAFLI